MRPVERGTAPRTYSKYGDAIGDLEERLGTYCSYCERRLPASLAVEHVVPKDLHPELKTEWTNFLLACANCNSVKGDQPVEVDNFLWCDRDNTFLAFAYSNGGFVQLADNLNEVQKNKAQALLDLVGLQRHKASGWGRPASRDKRWQDRELAWASAEACRDNFENIGQTNEARKLVLEVAKYCGFFSVWMNVFSDYPDVKRELIKIFTGTATSCFDEGGEPINRLNSIL